VHEVRTGELDAAAKGRDKAAVLDEHARHREPEDREPREGDEVDPFEDEDPRDGEREERDDARKQCPAGRVPSSGRDNGRPEIAQAQRKRPDDDAVCDPCRAVEERGADRERRGRNRDQEPAPEVMAIEADRVCDQLADGALGR